MRPAGEIRIRLLSAMHELGAPVTSRELAKQTQVGFEMTRRTLANLVRDGRVKKAAEPLRVVGVLRPVPQYELLSSAAEPEPVQAAA